jgi:hypothetical protein
MTNELNGSEAREASLERLYMELTGASESAARNVFMHVCCEDVENGCPAREPGASPVRVEAQPGPSVARSDVNGGGWLEKAAAVPGC